MDMKQRRKGALTCKPCALCGSLVDERDLIMSEVQGLRGRLVCSAHPWEREARVKPSFQDRGGVGQVPDLSIDPIWPGSNGGWILLADSEENVTTVYKTASTTRSLTTTLTDDPDLQTGIVAAGTYLVQLTLRLDTDIGATFRGALSYSGTTSDAIGVAIVFHASGFSAADATMTQLATLTSTFVTALNVAGEFAYLSMYVITTSSGTIALQWAQNSAVADLTILERGSMMTVTQLA